MPRTHNRDCFHKFVTFDTAKIIIESKSLRWSSPLKFNDPFDTQTGFVAEIDEEQFVTRFMSRVEELIFSAELPEYFNPDDTFHSVTHQLRGVRDRIPKSTIMADLAEEALKIARNMPHHLQRISQALSEGMCHARIFCLTENVNNVVMWSHYADEHRGVAFKFRCLDDIDHPFLIAKKVEYKEQYLTLGSAIDLADHYTGAKKIDMIELSWRAVYMKHLDWSYENEWRCYWPLLNEPSGDGFKIAKQDPRLFEAVYLGCNMVDEQVDVIRKLLVQHLPATKIYKARKSTTSFDLIFEELI